MSLQLRLNLATGLLAGFIMSALVAAVLLDAQPRMRAENNSMMQLTERLISSSLGPLLQTDDPSEGLKHITAQLSSLRHVTVRTEWPGTQPKAASADGAKASLFDQDLQPERIEIPVASAGKLIGTVVITARSDDELDELWQSADKIIGYGAALIVALIVLNSLVIRWSLAPMDALQEGIAMMEQGQYAAAMPEAGTTELRRIGASLNRLATKLMKARADNQTLTSQLVRVQEEERKGLARDLHDEIGANLFVLRTKAALLRKKLTQSQVNLERAGIMSTELIDEIERLQMTNRRILQSLMPPALQELGLRGALNELVAMWRKHQPAVTLDCTCAGDTAILDGTLEITAYRIVQEALTNAYRHGAPTAISATVEIAGQQPLGAQLVVIRVKDNGRGMPADSTVGFGIQSMRNRALALGGSFEMNTAATCGVEITASLPVTHLEKR